MAVIRSHISQQFMHVYAYPSKLSYEVTVINVTPSLLFINCIYNNLMYNISGYIHSIFTNMAKTIVVRQGNQGNSSYWNCFPPFLWLLRDVALDLPEIDGKKLTATEYLKTEVLCGPESKDSRNMEVALRTALTNYFPEFECRMLPIPSASKIVLANVGSSQDQLNSLFNEGVDELIGFLKTYVKPKKVFNATRVQCDGPTLAVLVQEVANAINKPHSIPALENTWKMVVESRCRAVQEKLLALYKITIMDRYDQTSKSQPLEEVLDSSHKNKVSVIGIHEQVWAEITKKLHNELGPILSTQATGECTLESVTTQLQKQVVQYREEINPHTQTKIKRVVGGALFKVIEENRNRSRKFCNKLFESLYAPIRAKVAAGKEGYSAEGLAADIENVLEEYDEKSVGPEKWLVRASAETTIKQNREIFEMHLEELLRRAQAQREAAENYEKIQGEMQILQEQSRQINESIRNSEKQRKEEEMRRKQESEAIEKELKDKISQLEQKGEEMYEKELERKLELKDEQHKREMAEQKLKNMEEKHEKIKKEEALRKAAIDKELEATKASLKAKEDEETVRNATAQKEIQDLKTQIEEWQKKLQQKEKQEEERKAQADMSMKKLEQDLQKKKKEAAEEIDKYKRKLKEKADEINNQHEVVEKLKAEYQMNTSRINKEKEEEKRLKVLAKEETETIKKRLKEVLENKRREEKEVERKWEEKITQKEKDRKILSDQLTEFEKKWKKIGFFELQIRKRQK